MFPVVDEAKFDVMVTGPLSGSLIGLGTGSRRHDYVFSVDVFGMGNIRGCRSIYT